MVAGLGFAEEGLHLAPHHLDGVEVGGVGGKEADFGAELFDQGEGAFVFMGTEVVHDDDVARTQRGDKHLAHIGVEDLGVGRSLDGHAGGGAIQPHRGDHRGGAPMPVRSMADQSFAPGRTTAQTRHVGLGRRLVDEDESRRVEPSLAAFPSTPGLGDVRPVLFGRMESLFLYVSPSFAST